MSMSLVPEPEPEESEEAPEVAEGIPVIEFEGEFVRTMEGKLPAIVLAMPEGYARGTHLKLMLEVRVRNVRYEESKKRDEGLVRQHIFALEDAQLIGAYTAEQMDPGVGGSASASAQEDDDEVGF